ncbi:hypothetical protein GBAR_LOCUS25247, partial [Geodia barretti]
MSMVSKTLLESCNIAGFPLVVGLMLYGHLFLQSLLSYCTNTVFLFLV